jgi:hypothetical protein
MKGVTLLCSQCIAITLKELGFSAQVSPKDVDNSREVHIQLSMVGWVYDSTYIVILSIGS